VDFFALEQRLDACNDHIHGDYVESALRNDDVGITFGRLDKIQVHGADGSEILVYDRFYGTTSFLDISLETADEADIRIGIYEDFDVT
jgi:hypothetical protein